jgi:transposase
MEQNDYARIEAFRQLKKEIRGSNNYLVIGIDVGKHKHHAFLGTTSGKTLLRRIIVENSASGFEYLLDMVQFYQTRDGIPKTVFAVEPTSVYHKPLSEFLIEHGYMVVYVTNEAIKKNRVLLDGRWDKHDTKDAANIADLVSQGKCQYYDLPDVTLRDLRSLLLLRKRLLKQQHSARVRIRNNLVAQYFPELDSYWNQAETENLAIVRWCLAPRCITQLRFEDFVQMVAPQYRGITQYQRLKKIWEIAPHSIGCGAGTALELEAKIMVEGLRYIQQQIDELEAAIKAICRSFADYELLLTIPGFGPYVSAVVLAAIGNAHRFRNASAVLRLAGFDLSAHRSGTKSATVVPVISKKGKAALRYALYQAAVVATSFNRDMRAYYHRLLEGREREKGIRTKMRVKLAAKLLVIAWTLMRKKVGFDPQHFQID